MFGGGSGDGRHRGSSALPPHEPNRSGRTRPQLLDLRDVLLCEGSQAWAIYHEMHDCVGTRPTSLEGIKICVGTIYYYRPTGLRPKPRPRLFIMTKLGLAGAGVEKTFNGAKVLSLLVRTSTFYYNNKDLIF